MPERIARNASFHEEAQREFHEASREYAAESKKLSHEFEVEVERCVALIERNPEIAPALGAESLRAKVLRRFPYSLVYAIEPDRLRVLAVAHQKRRPGFWSGRR